MLKLAVSGCQGRMGQRITHLALEDSDLQLTTLLEHTAHPKAQETLADIAIQTDNNALSGNDVLIEFTLPDGTMENLRACVKHNVKMVIGTTGFTDDQIAEIHKASKTIPIVFATNMSVGVNLMFKLTQLAAEKTGPNYQMNIEEGHHIHKKDAPSGTAKTLQERAEESGKRKIENPVTSIREGEIIGDHTITFESGDDVITITHHAKTRDIFARGALVAAKFLKNQSSGLFTMQDVLGLN